MSTIVRLTCVFLWFGAWVIFPHGAHAQVVISEIAWMGAPADANDEWIELHNQSSSPVDVTGWTIDDGDALFITLVGSISSNGFVLLERSDDNAVTSVSAFQIYTGALSNTGKTITLRDSVASKIDTVVGGENWSSIGGNNTHKYTPQRTESGGWITAPSTPGTANASSGTTPDTEETSTQPTTNTSRNSSGGKVVYGTPAPPIPKPDQLVVTIDAPSILYVNQSADFKLSATGPGKTIISSLAYHSNFGDTFVSTEKEPAHSFAYPGEYVVVLDAEYAKQVAQARHEITVLPVSFTLSRGSRGELLLTNHSSEEVDIGGFTLQGVSPFTFPKHTFIKAGAVLAISAERVGNGSAAVLFDVTKAPVASLESPRFVRASPTPRTVPLVVSSHTEPTPPVAKLQEPEIPTGVIRIGTDTTETKSGNVVTRFFQKIRGIFSSN